MIGMTFKHFKDADDFCKNYPFAPYQFQLVQKIFEQIRKVGATGLHLAKGGVYTFGGFESLVVGGFGDESRERSSPSARGARRSTARVT